MDTDEMLHDIMDIDDIAGDHSEEHQGKDNADVNNHVTSSTVIDSYPYTFSPLLLFADSAYFDKGHSNYNAVESFFSRGGIFPILEGEDYEDDDDVDDVDGHGGHADVARGGPDASEPPPPRHHHPQPMKTKVLFERKNMTYEELLDYIVREEMLVTCCIDDHFTAFQVLRLPSGRGGKRSARPCLIYYDPLSPHIKLVYETNAFQHLAIFLLLKCNYGDSTHIQENKGHYKPNSMDISISAETRQLRKTILRLWEKINSLDSPQDMGYNLTSQMIPVPLKLNQYVFINDHKDTTKMSTQLTGNTCYFQVFLFATLCLIGQVRLDVDNDTKSYNGPGSRFTSGGNGPPSKYTLILDNLNQLQQTTIDMSKFLVEFFVTRQQQGEQRKTILRPLTNSNILLDFYRYEQAPYYDRFVDYLRRCSPIRIGSPSIVNDDTYKSQYDAVLKYFTETRILHLYQRLSSEGPMSSTPNTKLLQLIKSADEEAAFKLGGSDYFKYRPCNLMFGCNAAIISHFDSFQKFNSWRKNQLLRYMIRDEDNGGDKGSNGGSITTTKSIVASIDNTLQVLLSTSKGTTKYRDYYFMPQFEIGQSELVDLHHYTYLLDTYARQMCADTEVAGRIHGVNHVLFQDVFFSTNKHHDYEKILPLQDFKNKHKKSYGWFLDGFLTAGFLGNFVGLGFSDCNPNEKEINSLTQTVFYTKQLAGEQSNRRSAEFEKECINQMARSNLRRYLRTIDSAESKSNVYKLWIRIGHGYTYTKYNTLMHFLNVIQCYWNNPDISNVQLFGKDIRTLLVLSSQKIAFGATGGYYNYGPIIRERSTFRGTSDVDLAVSQSKGDIVASVADDCRTKHIDVILADRVYDYTHMKSILQKLLSSVNGQQLKSDNEVVNLCLLSLMLDFGLYQKYCHLLHLDVLDRLQHRGNQKELQVECANWIYEFDRKNTADKVKRGYVEELLTETSYSFLVNKDFDVRSSQFNLIQILNGDPDYQKYVLLVKIYMSLCQINKSVEVDYYKVVCNGEFRIVIPETFSKAIADYLIDVTKRYTFSVDQCIMIYDEHPLFDLRPEQPDIRLYKVRLDSATDVSSMVKYIEISHAFKRLGKEEEYLVFMADNVLMMEVDNSSQKAEITINKVAVQIATIFFNKAVSFIPCFKYDESDDVVLFTSPRIHYLVDKGGQFCSDYYGMKEELLEYIKSQEVYVDLNDNHVFKESKLCELLTESKTAFYFPDYLLQVPSRQHLINLLDFAVKIRNVSLFILVLIYLRRASVRISYHEKEGTKVNISGPWRAAILYVIHGDRGVCHHSHYDEIFSEQFFDLNQHKNLPLDDFIDVLCDNFCKYQRFIDGEYQIIPRPKQKDFLKKIITSEECFHFSEVGSGKTKVILPLLCQIFLSNNIEAHRYFSRDGEKKDTLVVLVPEHLVSDARTQVYRYCLNLNFRQEYKVFDDIFVLLNDNVAFNGKKKIFITSFNQFKKALTYDEICRKVRPHREHILVVADEIDDFLDRDKLVFNICSNKNSSFDRPTLDLFFETSRATYDGQEPPDKFLEATSNFDYWKHLYLKFQVINSEIQDASRSLNKSFGIFNAYTLRHCSSNVAHDIEGYKALIARPYESVNRAMAGSYYSDVERTIYLTYVCLKEDIAKYDELFQSERKYISFEYWSEHFLHYIEYDDLVYGHEKLSQIYEQHPEVQDGLTRYLYEIILRRMEVRDESRSVNSVDIIFNFDCIGFTGTPFLDNYPTFKYIREKREDTIPDLIDRSFYAYSSEGLSAEAFKERFQRFQGHNDHVEVKYVSSDFIRDSTDEMATLGAILERENDGPLFNAIVDLCGVFKRSTIHDVRNLIREKYGAERFRYVYHIDQSDNSDRVLYMDSDNDVLYDEEFYRYLYNQYGANLRDRIFFFIDNRNVIGKDIPFQLIYQKHFGRPLMTKAVVLAHDVHDFSKIWQAMGRSRTMNETVFSIYKSGLEDRMDCSEQSATDIKSQSLTQELYVRNCDNKMAGNISSMFLTVVALQNIQKESFYYRDTIVNVFLEKMEGTITQNVSILFKKLRDSIVESSQLSRILYHIIADKFSRSANRELRKFNKDQLVDLLGEIVTQKFEQRNLSNDIYDEYIAFLSGEQKGSMEVSYTKQQQKQKQKQHNKNQDSDAMGIFNKRNQLVISFQTDNYFKYAHSPSTDGTKLAFNLPSPIPILTLNYARNGRQRNIRVYPTLQFLYSHHIQSSYITDDVRGFYSLTNWDEKHVKRAYDGFWKHAIGDSPDPMEEEQPDERMSDKNGGSALLNEKDPISKLQIHLLGNCVRTNPQFTLVGLKEGVYLIGMKDQFNVHDLPGHTFSDRIQFVMDDMGFVLFDRTGLKSMDNFSPYFIENYILLETLSKVEVAQNVLDYYCNHKETIENGLRSYDESQGKGFVSWRFLMNEAKKAQQLKNASSVSPEKRKREE